MNYRVTTLQLGVFRFAGHRIPEDLVGRCQWPAPYQARYKVTVGVESLAEVAADEPRGSANRNFKLPAAIRRLIHCDPP